MGAFSELIVDSEAPIRVQFKHGMRWNYSYRIGDKISWDHMKRPPATAGQVIFPGICLMDSKRRVYKYFAICIDDDVITSAKEISELEYERLRAEKVDTV